MKPNRPEPNLATPITPGNKGQLPAVETRMSLPRTRSTLTAITIALATTTIVGCKVVLVPGQGGSIEGNKGSSCPEAELCELRIDTTDFLEEFTAVPQPGWTFRHWKRRDRALCGGSGQNTCTLDTTNFDAFPALLEFLNSDARFFLEPVFEPAPPLVEDWSKVFVITNQTAFCGFSGSGIPIQGRQYRARLTRYSNGLLRMQPLGGGFLGIEDPLRVDEYYWLPTAAGEYFHQFRWEWQFEDEWRLARGNVTWQLDPGATTLTTRDFFTDMLWPDIFGNSRFPGFSCRFRTRASGTVEPASN